MGFTSNPVFSSSGNGQMQPIGRQGSILNGLTGGAPREGSIMAAGPQLFQGLGNVFGPDGGMNIVRMPGAPGQGAPGMGAPSITSGGPSVESGPQAGAAPGTPPPAQGGAPAAPGGQSGGIVGFLTGLLGGGQGGAPGGQGVPGIPGGGGGGVHLGAAPAAPAPTPAAPSPMIPPPSIKPGGWSPQGFSDPLLGGGTPSWFNNGYLGARPGLGAPPP